MDLTNNASSAKINSIVKWAKINKNHASKLKVYPHHYALCTEHGGPGMPMAGPGGFRDHGITAVLTEFGTFLDKSRNCPLKW